MITYGYAKDYYYTGSGVLMIKVRIPSIHGPYKQVNYNGQRIRNYVRDEDLPYYQSLLLSHIPNEGEVVAVASTNNGNNDFLVLGCTGGSYTSGITDIGE